MAINRKEGLAPLFPRSTEVVYSLFVARSSLMVSSQYVARSRSVVSSLYLARSLFMVFSPTMARSYLIFATGFAIAHRVEEKSQYDLLVCFSSKGNWNCNSYRLHMPCIYKTINF